MTTSSEPAIRPARLDDLDELVDIYLASARHHVAIDPDSYAVPDRESAARRLGRLLARSGPDFAYLAAEVGGRVVGSLTIGRMDDASRGSMLRGIATAEVGIAVLEERRGRGVGRALMAAAEDWAAGNGIRRIFLDVNVRNAGALGFYRRLGFETRGHYLDKEIADGDVR